MKRRPARRFVLLISPRVVGMVGAHIADTSARLLDLEAFGLVAEPDQAARLNRHLSAMTEAERGAVTLAELAEVARTVEPDQVATPERETWQQRRRRLHPWKR